MLANLIHLMFSASLDYNMLWWAWFDLGLLCSFMVPKHTKPTANVASKRPHQVTDMKTKLKVTTDYGGRKPVMGIAHQSGMSFATTA